MSGYPMGFPQLQVYNITIADYVIVAQDSTDFNLQPSHNTLGEYMLTIFRSPLASLNHVLPQPRITLSEQESNRKCRVQ